MLLDSFGGWSLQAQSSLEQFALRAPSDGARQPIALRDYRNKLYSIVHT